MPARFLGLALALAFAACDDAVEQAPDASVGSEKCANLADDDGDDLYDCADPDCQGDSSCQVTPPKPCDAQQTCGDIVYYLVTRVCVDHKCVPPGPSDSQGKPLEVEAGFTIKLQAPFGMGTLPRSAVIRFIYPKRVDGTPISCAEVLTLNGADEATRDRLDGDRTVNQVFRALYPLPTQNPSSNDVFYSTTSWFIPRGKGYLLYGEVWSGERQLNHPKGIRLSATCDDNGGKGFDLESAPEKTRYTLSFPAPPG